MVQVNWSAILVDWPGLGNSDSPSVDYNADVKETFLVDFLKAKMALCQARASRDSDRPVVFTGGHAAALVLRAAKKGLMKPSAIAAVAPTWAGPLPIVFGRSSNMETRCLLRDTLKTPAVGWMVYNMLVSDKKAIQSQYKSHVYGDPDNATSSIIESRYELTKRQGARYVPAAFLTGILDPVTSREEFLDLFASMDAKIPVWVTSSTSSPKRPKAEMEALRDAKGVTKYVEVPGAILPQEVYTAVVASVLYDFLEEFLARSS